MQLQLLLNTNPAYHATIRSLWKNGIGHICTHCVCEGSENENSSNNLKTLSNKIVALKRQKETFHKLNLL